MSPIFAVSVVGISIVGCSSARLTAKDPEVCVASAKVGPLYTDAEAKSMMASATAAVPAGETHLKSEVFSLLGIDANRLCARRIYGIQRVFVESWRISANFDISWKTTASDGHPAASENRRIFGVRILERERTEGGPGRISEDLGCCR
jgi:hypothetical protein